MTKPISVTVTRGAWVRRPERNRAFAVASVAIGLGCLAVPIIFAGRGSDTKDFALQLFLLVIVFGVVPIVVAVRLATGIYNAGVMITDREVVIRGPFKTWTVPIEDAVEFSPGWQPGAGNGTGGMVLKLRDGRTISIWAMAKESFVWNINKTASAFEPTAEKLNVLLRESRSEAAPSLEPIVRNPNPTEAS